MALSGTIADWSFADILQVIAVQQKSGSLDLESGGERVSFTFSQGKIAAAELMEAGRQSGFLRFLVDTGRLAPAGARKVAALVQKSGGGPIETIERSGLLSGERLPAAIADFAQELVYRVLQWEEGEYEFVAHAVPAVPGQPPLATEGLLFEGMRRLDEWSRITQIVQPQTVFRLVPGASVPVGLPLRERALHRLIDGIQDVRALGRLAPLTEYEVGESLAALHEARLIEVSTSGTAVGEIIELGIDDLEPEPRLFRLLRTGSLAALVAASIVFGALTHGADWAARSTGDELARAEQAVRFSLELYRSERGSYPAELRELEALGIDLRGAGAPLVYRPATDLRSYTLAHAAQRPRRLPLGRRPIP